MSAEETITTTKIFVVKVTANQEKVVAEMMYNEAVRRRMEGNEQSDIYSILYAPELKGYVLVESENPGTVADLAMNVPKTKGLLLRKKGDLNSAGTISIEELTKILMPTPIVEKVNKGDLVELIAGPFTGEKARVAKINKDKNEITVELIEAAVPIPVIVRGYDIKILRREGEEEPEEKKEEKERTLGEEEKRPEEEKVEEEKEIIEKIEEEPSEEKILEEEKIFEEEEKLAEKKTEEKVEERK